MSLRDGLHPTVHRPLPLARILKTAWRQMPESRDISAIRSTPSPRLMPCCYALLTLSQYLPPAGESL